MRCDPEREEPSQMVLEGQETGSTSAQQGGGTGSQGDTEARRQLYRLIRDLLVERASGVRVDR